MILPSVSRFATCVLWGGKGCMPWREALGTLVRERRASRRELNSDGGGCAGAAAVSFGKKREMGMGGGETS